MAARRGLTAEKEISGRFRSRRARSRALLQIRHPDPLKMAVSMMHCASRQLLRDRQLPIFCRSDHKELGFYAVVAGLLPKRQRFFDTGPRASFLRY